MFEMIIGELRPLTKHERAVHKGMTYVVETPFVLRLDNKSVYVKRGFMTDGSTFSPDIGFSWLFHDYLYTTHRFSTGEVCTRRDADDVMIRVLKAEHRYWFCKLFTFLCRTAPFSYVFDKHYRGKRSK